MTLVPAMLQEKWRIFMYFKILEDSLMDRGYKYKEGLNVNLQPFDPEPIYNSGGLYFADENQICGCCNLGSKISEVVLFPGETIVLVHGREYKAHQIILKEIRDLWTLETFKWLKESGVNFHTAKDLAFRCAARYGHLDILKYLEDTVKDVSTYNCALCYAAENGHLDVIKYLIGLGAKARNEEALSNAAANGQLETVKFLTELGTDIHSYHEEALKVAASELHWDIVRYLVGKGADIHIEDEWVLRSAALSGNIQMIKWLIDRGADIRVKNNYIKSLVKNLDNKKILFYLEYLEFMNKMKHLLKNIKISN